MIKRARESITTWLMAHGSRSVVMRLPKGASHTVRVQDEFGRSIEATITYSGMADDWNKSQTALDITACFVMGFDGLSLPASKSERLEVVGTEVVGIGA